MRSCQIIKTNLKSFIVLTTTTPTTTPNPHEGNPIQLHTTAGSRSGRCCDKCNDFQAGRVVVSVVVQITNGKRQFVTHGGSLRNSLCVVVGVVVGHNYANEYAHNYARNYAENGRIPTIRAQTAARTRQCLPRCRRALWFRGKYAARPRTGPRCPKACGASLSFWAAAAVRPCTGRRRNDDGTTTG